MTPRKRINEQRKRLLGRERATILEMKNQYGKAWVTIKAELDALGVQIKAAKAAGEDVNSTWLLKQRRLESIERTTRAEITIFTQAAQGIISEAQMQALFAGQQDAASLVIDSLGLNASGVAFTPVVPPLAIQDVVGRSQTGRFLGDILATLPGQAAQEVKTGLLRGVMLGRNPRVIAREIRAGLAGNQARALTIARTEMLGAYREAALESYRANSDVVSGWEWDAEPDACDICQEKDGEVAATEDDFETHPNCRCSPVPVTVSWDEILGG